MSSRVHKMNANEPSFGEWDDLETDFSHNYDEIVESDFLSDHKSNSEEYCLTARKRI